MRKLPLSLIFVIPLLLGTVLVNSLAAQSLANKRQPASPEFVYDSDTPLSWVQQFVPDYRPFWDNSKNWTTNYGPAYRDTVLGPSYMLACSAEFALCFHSGAEPYPCHLSPDGRSANCLCTVGSTTNFTLMTAILNRPIYDETVTQCNPDGTNCKGVNSAPVCKYLNNGALIPGAEIISTYDPDSHQEVVDLITKGGNFTNCSKAPYAACMTAPCLLNGDGTANCKCPVFYGNFELTGKDAQCSLGGDLVPSASYIPVLDRNPKN